MLARPSLRSLLAATCAMLFVGACSESGPIAGPSFQRIPGTLLSNGTGGPGVVVVCSNGGPATFSASASPATGTLLGGGTFSVADGGCVDAWTATPGDYTISTLTVTQTSTEFDYVTAVAVPTAGTPYMVIDQATKSVTWRVNPDHGGAATFYQIVVPPPPPPPRKLQVCKEGPAGSYSFTVSAAGGLDNVFPSGTSFSVAAGECKDVWTTNTLPTPTDFETMVTVTEIGTSPLDSIVQALEYEPAQKITGTRSVSSRLNYFHGGVLTYYNAPPPPPPAGYLDVCKVGGPAGTYTFHVDVQGGGQFVLPNGSDKSVTFDGTNAACVTMYRPANYSSWPTGTTGTVEISEVGLPSTIAVQSITVVYNGTTGTPITNTTSTTVTMGYTDIATVRYVNMLKPTPRPMQGCTPGYWKVKQHWDSWTPTGYSTTQAISSVFNVPSSYVVNNQAMGSYSLVKGLSFQGGSTLSGKAEILLRAAIAGLLNTANGNVNYPAYTTADLISAVNAALASANATTITDLATKIDNLNNSLGGCPLN
jgi:hypothetical protein